MQVSVEDLSSVKKVMHIEVPAEDVARELDQAYNELRKTAKIKGFRPGKVPRSVLERHYKKSVMADVSQKLLQQSLIDAFAETKLQPLGMPVVDPPQLDEKEPYKFDATVEISPQIEDLDYKGLELVRTNYKASDEEIDGQLKIIQKTITDKATVAEDRPVRESDFVVVDYEAFRGDKPAADIPKTENYTLKIGAGVIHKDLDDQIVGMKKGESKKIPVKFLENNPNANLAGAEIVFDVTLKEIREEKIQEMNDEFAKKLGPFESLEELRNSIRQNLKEGYDKRIEQELNEQIFQALLTKREFEIPEVMVNLELDHIVSDIEKNVEAHNKTMEELGFTRESLMEKHRDTAEKQVKRQLLLNKIISQEKLDLTEEEMEKGFEEMAEAYKQPGHVMKQFYETNPEHLNFFKQVLLEKKAINLIIDNSSIAEKEPEVAPSQEGSGEE